MAPAYTRIAGLTNDNSVILTGNFDSLEIFDPDENRIAGPISANGGVNGDVAALPNGRFVIVYESLGEGVDEPAIGQRRDILAADSRWSWGRMVIGPPTFGLLGS